MSEKRFEWDRTGIFDNKTNHYYYKTFDNEEVVDLLNELDEKNRALELIAEGKLYSRRKLEKENKQLYKKLIEQQEKISYWKHRVSSLLMILSQFDNEKVKKLLEELDE